MNSNGRKLFAKFIAIRYFACCATVGFLSWSSLCFFSGGETARRPLWWGDIVNYGAIAACVVGIPAALVGFVVQSRRELAAMTVGESRTWMGIRYNFASTRIVVAAVLPASLLATSLLVSTFYFAPDQILLRRLREAIRPYNEYHVESLIVSVRAAESGDFFTAQEVLFGSDFLAVQPLVIAEAELKRYPWCSENRRHNFLLTVFASQPDDVRSYISQGGSLNVSSKVWDRANKSLSAVSQNTRDAILERQQFYNLKAIMCRR